MKPLLSVLAFALLAPAASDALVVSYDAYISNVPSETGLAEFYGTYGCDGGSDQPICNPPIPPVGTLATVELHVDDAELDTLIGPTDRWTIDQSSALGRAFSAVLIVPGYFEAVLDPWRYYNSVNAVSGLYLAEESGPFGGIHALQMSLDTSRSLETIRDVVEALLPVGRFDADFGTYPDPLYVTATLAPAPETVPLPATGVLLIGGLAFVLARRKSARGA